MTQCLRLSNFTQLSEAELLMILERRNQPEVRQWMTNSEPIAPEDHLRFCARLKEQPDTLMLFAEFNGQPASVISFHAQDPSWHEIADFGCYAFYPQVDSAITIEHLALLHLVAQRGVKRCHCKVKANNRLAELLVTQVLGAHEVARAADYTYFELSFPEPPAHYQAQLNQRLAYLKLQLELRL